MKKLLLTVLISTTLLSVANAEQNFHLQKAGAFNTIVSQADNAKGGLNKNTCYAECYSDFDYCTYGLNPQGIEYEYCEMDLDLCLDFCDYGY